MSAPTLLLSLFNYKAWANDELFTALKQISAEHHSQELHSAIRILNHIYVVDQIFAANLQGIRHNFTATNTTATPTPDELHAAVQKTDLWYLQTVAEFSVQQLETTMLFTFTDGDPGKMTREQMLAHVITHGGYHRGAVGRIMTALSVEAPRDIYTKFLRVSTQATNQ